MEQEKEQAARLDRKLKREENTESNMPQVLDYVQQKAELYEVCTREPRCVSVPRCVCVSMPRCVCIYACTTPVERAVTPS